MSFFRLRRERHVSAMYWSSGEIFGDLEDWERLPGNTGLRVQVALNAVLFECFFDCISLSFFPPDFFVYFEFVSAWTFAGILKIYAHLAAILSLLIFLHFFFGFVYFLFYFGVFTFLRLLTSAVKKEVLFFAKIMRA